MGEAQGSRESGSVSWKAVYVSAGITFALSGFMWQWWRGEIAFVSTRILGVETRLDQRISIVEANQRQDRAEVLGRLDSLSGQLNDVYKLLLQQKPGR